MNGVYETTTTSGNGLTIALSAVTGRPRFADVGIGAVVPIAMRDGGNWQWVLGTVRAGNTLDLDNVVATYVGGIHDNTSPERITLSGGQVDVWLAPIAEVVSPGMPIVSSVYGRKALLSPHWSTYPSGTLTVIADLLYVIPFKVDSAYDINGFHIDMNTAGAAGTKARIGLYRIKADGQPGSLVVESGDIDTSVAPTVLTAPVTQTRIEPGWYYLGFVNSGTPTYQAYPSSVYGMSPLGLDGANSAMLPIQIIYKTIAGWSSLPTDPVTFTRLTPGQAAIPAISLKLV